MAASLVDTLGKLARQNRTVRGGPAWLGRRCRRRQAALPHAACNCPPALVQVCMTIHQPNSYIASRFGEC